MPQERIRHNYRRSLDSGNAESFCRCDTGCTKTRTFFARRYERNIFASWIRKVAVYFIADHNNMMSLTKFTDFCKLFLRPYFSNWIMWIAENHQAGLRICKFFLKVFKIHMIFTVFIDKRTFKDIAAIV